MMTYNPTEYTPEGLRAHGRVIAERLKLSSEQVAVLVSELRNALAPGIMNLDHLGTDAHDEVVSDIRNSIERVLAIATALAETTTRS
jgi:hypothetical protein